MKLKRTKSKIYSKIIILIIVIIPVAFGMYYAIRSILLINNNFNINSPKQNILLNVPLAIDIDFNNEVEKKGAIDKFVSSINRAKQSVEIAMFSLRSDRIQIALREAARRGVKITLILDSSRKEQHDKALQSMASDKNIKRIDSGKYDAENSQNSAYMHHKFMIIDRGLLEAELTSGSLNFTDIGEKYNQSFYFTTSDPTLISIYGNEFDLLKNGESGVEKLDEKSYDPWTANIQYTDSRVEVWMSPGLTSRSARNRIFQLIDSATSSIDLMMWYLTDEKIAQSLVKKSQEGVKIRIITEDTNATTTDSILPLILSLKKEKTLSNMEVILDTKLTAQVKEPVPAGFNPYMHEHTMIIDNKTVIFGTSNWSSWGFFHNDEDIIITDNKYLVEQFKKTFDYFYKVLK